MLAEVMRSGLLGSTRRTSSDAEGGMPFQGVGKVQRVRENDDETQREESNSTESTHQEVIIHACRVASVDYIISIFPKIISKVCSKPALSVKCSLVRTRSIWRRRGTGPCSGLMT